MWWLQPCAAMCRDVATRLAMVGVLFIKRNLAVAQYSVMYAVLILSLLLHACIFQGVVPDYNKDAQQTIRTLCTQSMTEPAIAPINSGCRACHHRELTVSSGSCDARSMKGLCSVATHCSLVSGGNIGSIASNSRNSCRDSPFRLHRTSENAACSTSPPIIESPMTRSRTC
jgi:hypothetical protein